MFKQKLRIWLLYVKLHFLNRLTKHFANLPKKASVTDHPENASGPKLNRGAWLNRSDEVSHFYSSMHKCAQMRKQIPIACVWFECSFFEAKFSCVFLKSEIISGHFEEFNVGTKNCRVFEQKELKIVVFAKKLHLSNTKNSMLLLNKERWF